jgi:predicted small integral membrane protein
MKSLLSKLATQTIPGSIENSAGDKSLDDVYKDSGMSSRGIFGSDNIVETVINLVLYLVGIIAVVMLIVGGIRYATSSGDEKKITSAKNTIIYSLLGLAFAILAWTLVNFVFVSLSNQPAGGTSSGGTT